MLRDDMRRVFELAGQLDILDRKQGFTDSRGRYFGRFVVAADPYGRGEIRRHGDDINAVISDVLVALEARAAGEPYEKESGWTHE